MSMRLFVCLILGLSLFFSSCEETNPDNTFNIGSNTNLTFTGTLNGTKVTHTEGFNGFSNSWGESPCAIADTNGNYLCRLFTRFSNDTITATIYFIGIFSSSPTTAEVDSILLQTSLPYGDGISSPLTNIAPGVVIVYVDADGVEWSTNRGDQTGSIFTITEHIENPYDDFTQYLTSGTFSCRMYNDFGGNISFTNASFAARTVTN